MQKLILITFVVFVWLAGVDSIRAQQLDTTPKGEPISAEKAALIKELLSLMGDSKLMKETMELMLSTQQMELEKMTGSLLDDDPTLAGSERKLIEKSINSSVEKTTARFKELFDKEIDLDKLVLDVFTPLYARTFTEQELREMIAFYRSTTGQKIITTTPQMVADSMKAMFDILMPKIRAISKQVAQESVADVKRNLPKPRRKRKS